MGLVTISFLLEIGKLQEEMLFHGREALEDRFLLLVFPKLIKIYR